MTSRIFYHSRQINLVNVGILVFGILFCTVFVSGDKETGEQINEKNPYRRLERLDRNGKYWVEWNVDWVDKSVTFNVTVETTGYVGFGLSRKGKMAGADIVIGGVLSNGVAYFSDRHAIANQTPTEDASQDWTLHEAWENSTHTFLSFSRPFDTCDQDHDFPINDDTAVLIWAYGERDDDLQYHFQNRGHFYTYLLNPEPTPRRVKDAERSRERLTELGNLKVWSINITQQVAPQDTTYICTFHKAPRHSTKQHIVGNIMMNIWCEFEAILRRRVCQPSIFRPIIDSDIDRRHVHHFVMHRCYPPKGVSAKRFFDRFVNRPGKQCYAFHIPSSIPTEYCRDYMYVWGVRGTSFFLPEHTGVPMNADSEDDYYLLQTHYDNPQMIPGIVVKPALEIFYTENVRKYDAGIMLVGLGLPGSPSFMLPSHSVNHEYYGHCGNACTTKMFPADGVKFFATNLHTHLAGTGSKIIHIRNNRELPPILEDANYMFDYQPIQTFRNERTILPGDSVILKCLYDTTNSNGSATVGGFSTHNEMCNVLQWYYPHLRVPNGDNDFSVYSTCSGEINSKEYRRFLKIWNTTWSDEQVENLVTAPIENAGLTTREVGMRTEWPIEKRQQLQNYHKYSEQITWCPDVGPGAVGQLSSLPSGGIFPNWKNNEYTSSYSENHVMPYERPKGCHL